MHRGLSSSSGYPVAMSISAQFWRRVGLPVGSGVVATLLGLLIKATIHTQCETETENVAGERCEYLHAHPIWYFVPAPVILLCVGLVAWGHPPRWVSITAISLSIALAVALAVGPHEWIATARHGGP
jgi:hypothetical protein